MNESALLEMNITELRQMAKDIGVHSPTTLRKQALIDAMLVVAKKAAAVEQSRHKEIEAKPESQDIVAQRRPGRPAGRHPAESQLKPKVANNNEYSAGMAASVNVLPTNAAEPLHSVQHETENIKLPTRPPVSRETPHDYDEDDFEENQTNSDSVEKSDENIAEIE